MSDIEKKELLHNLRESLTNLYDDYTKGNRNGTAIFVDELNGFLRMGKELDFDQSQISFMNISNSFIKLSNNIKSSTVRFENKEEISLRDIEEDSPEYVFLTEILKKAEKGKSK